LDEQLNTFLFILQASGTSYSVVKLVFGWEVVVEIDVSRGVNRIGRREVSQGRNGLGVSTSRTTYPHQPNSLFKVHGVGTDHNNILHITLGKRYHLILRPCTLTKKLSFSIPMLNYITTHTHTAFTLPSPKPDNFFYSNLLPFKCIHRLS
jgi:hypothetical protein